jgi:hypothetical protein
MIRFAKVCAVVFAVSTVSSLAMGCALRPDDAERFREAVPVQEEVALRVPGGANATGGTKSSSLRIQTEPGAGGGAVTTNARYYQMTRDLTGAVDFGTAIILGGVWAIVHTAPTTIEAKKAVWGPGSGNALEPAIWRFTVSEVGDAEYDYVLEGQPKTGGAWLAVLNGHGFGKSRPEHKQGWFKFDNDNYKKLEPTRGRDEGSTKVTYDLRKLPATIDVEMRPATDKGWVDVKVTHDNAGAGSVEIDGQGDIEALKNTKLEDIHLLSRWSSNGSGRADVTMKNGDLPFTVDASECWSTSFARVFYKDTVDYEPPTGDAKACTFSQAKL